MIQALYTGASGLSASQRNVDVISHNMANVNTLSFKAKRLGFKDALYQAMVAPIETGNDLQLGHGVLPSSVTSNFSIGSAEHTGQPLDFMILNDGFFAVLDGAGQTRYTRNGSFRVSADADGNFLVNENGNYLLQPDGTRVELFGTIEEFQTLDNGSYSYVLPDTGEVVTGQIGVFSFPNNNGLVSMGNNEYTASDASGAATVVEQSQIRQKTLETSNVDLGTEMARLVRAQRAMQLASRIVTTADEMESMANNIRA